MNPQILAGILKNFYEDFDIGLFRDRLRLQKIIYLMQAFGLNIGYSYSLYLYGPYSTELTRDGFAMPDLKKVQKVDFEEEQDKKIFRQFKQFIEDKKTNNDRLEIIASAHLLKKLGYTEQNIINTIKSKHGDLFKNKDTEIAKAINELKEQGVFQ